MVGAETPVARSAIDADSWEWWDVRLGMASCPGVLDQLRVALEICWSLHDEVPTGIRIQVGIAAAEVAANIVEHGDAEWLWVRMHVGVTQMLLAFTDDGGPVKVDLAGVSMPDEFSERGRGLPIAKAALGLFSYHRDRFGNHWQMVSRAFGSAESCGSFEGELEQ